MNRTRRQLEEWKRVQSLTQKHEKVPVSKLEQEKFVLVTKTMPYTKAALIAATAWLEDSEIDISEADLDEVSESLAEMVHSYHVYASTRSKGSAK